MKVIKAILFILLVILAQAIVGYLEFRYLSLTLGLFAIALIVFVQGLQMVLEYNIFSSRIKWLPKLFYIFVIIAIMAMNINYLELSRKDFDQQDKVEKIEEEYKEELAHYNELLRQYENEYKEYKAQIEEKKSLHNENYQAELERYESLLTQYENRKAFLEDQ
ncbi:MAG: hypothetical protein ACOCV8_00800, partial [Spirochaetota bacterium]